MKLSIVIPVYKSESSLENLFKEIHSTFRDDVSYEIIFVNDGSPDNSWNILKKIKKDFPKHIKLLNLAQNAGENNAVMAGYNHAKGDYIVHIDDDLQNPPSEILKLLYEIEKGYDVVYSRYSNKMHTCFRNFASKVHNGLAYIFLRKPKGLYLSTFRVISASLKEKICLYKKPYTYIDALILKSTKNIRTIEVKHNPRHNQVSNYTFLKLICITKNMIFLQSRPFIVYPFMFILILVTAFIFLQSDLEYILAPGMFFWIWMIIELIKRQYSDIIQRPQYIIKDLVE